MRKQIDQNYRPANYFWALEHGIELPSNIKGAERKSYYERKLFEIDTGFSTDPFSQPSLTVEQRSQVASIHPAFMGGEYLPDRETGEVEIARITLSSTTQDVTSVYARKTHSGIAFRVVDEYDGDTLDGEPNYLGTRPMALSEITEFFMDVWNLGAVLSANFAEHGYPKRKVKALVNGSSSFYAQFGQAIQFWIDQWLLTVR